MKPAVLLMAHGSPESPEEMEPYLRRVMRHRAPTPELVAEMQARYRAIGGRSPLLDITRRQAAALAAKLGLAVHVAMRTWHPLIEEVAPAIEGSPIVALPMAPHASPFSTDLYFDALAAVRKDVVPIRSWAALHGLARAWAEKIAPALTSGATLLFTAHSVPAACAAYPAEVRATIDNVLALLPPAPWALAWQSRSPGPGAWLEPDVETALRQLAARGVRRVVVAAVGFVADHVEVLYDLDILARRTAESLGLEFRRTEMPNDSPALVEALADAVLGVPRGEERPPAGAPAHGGPAGNCPS